MQAHRAACTHQDSQPHPSSPGLVTPHCPGLRHETCSNVTSQSAPRRRGAQPDTRPAPSSLPEVFSPCPTCCLQRDNPKVPGHAKSPFWGTARQTPLGTAEASLAEARAFSRPGVLQPRRVQGRVGSCLVPTKLLRRAQQTLQPTRSHARALLRMLSRPAVLCWGMGNWGGCRMGLQ